MRLEEIERIKMAQRQAIPAVNDTDISPRLNHGFRLLPREPRRRRIARWIARPALLATARAAHPRSRVPLTLHADVIGVDDRFIHDSAVHFLMRRRRQPPDAVLVPGCYVAGEDVQFWLRRGVPKLVGIDLNSLEEVWATAVPTLEQAYGGKVEFRLSPLERTSFADATFDVIATNAVLEHVSNLPAMVKESARILKAGGHAIHSFGPLYFSFGADHCISQYGHEHGYDHLLLDESEYQKRIWDQEFFDKTVDPNFPFWARSSQFSYATAEEYIELFNRHFDVSFVAIALSGEGLRFREAYPAKWARLTRKGIREQDLLIKSMSVVLTKR